jgi:hypothetical protein
MLRAGFETATKRPQTYALDRVATGIGKQYYLTCKNYEFPCSTA